MAYGNMFVQWTSILVLLIPCTLSDHVPYPFNPNISNSFNITVTPHHLEDIHWKSSVEIYINITCQEAPSGLYHLNILPENAEVATVEVLEQTGLTCQGNDEASYRAVIYGKFLGRTMLKVSVEMVGDDGTGQPLQAEAQFKLVVVNRETALNVVFIVVVALLVVVINFGFGCKIDLTVVKAILIRPIPPIIGMLCQFLVMPLLGCGLTFLLGMDPILGFGVLVTASAPGGGGSNVWTYMLGGDIDLSITMTLFSKALALAMMPLWMFALGRFYIPGTQIKIPYSNIMYGLLSIIVPCLLGVLLAKYRPAAAKRGVQVIRPLSCFFILWVIVVGSITNPYVYVLMAREWYVIPAGTLLPYVGMIIGYTLSLITRQGNRRAMTIAIETGMQDTGIAIILLLSSFAKPDGDIAATMPITSAIFTPLPLLIALIFITVYNRCWLGGKCKCCGGPDILVLADIENEEDVISQNTKTSELTTPGEEKLNHLENIKEANGPEDRLLSNGDTAPQTNGHVV